MTKKTRMFYDIEQQRWCVRIRERNVGMHCGEQMDLYIGQKAISCRLELDRSWYEIMGETRFNLREIDHYIVSI